MSLHAPKTFLVRGEGNNGYFQINFGMGNVINIVCSDGGGWDHVSCSFPRRTPTWDEMQKVKDIFWDEEDCVVQFHPRKSTYVNIHNHCLHMWRWQGNEFPTPPTWMV